MARKTQNNIQKAVDDTPDRFKLSESGYLGLNVFNGVSNDEIKRESIC